MKKIVLVVVIFLMFFAPLNSVEAKKPAPSWDIIVTPDPHHPEEPIQIEVWIYGIRGKETNFNLRVSYGNGPLYDSWWGGMSGPAYSTQGFSHQTWMECTYSGGCTEWWEGTLPKGKNSVPYDTIVIPLTTSYLTGYWQDAVSVEMTINGVKEIKSIPISTN